MFSVANGRKDCLIAEEDEMNLYQWTIQGQGQECDFFLPGNE
jgi:hypothetical protein